MNRKNLIAIAVAAVVVVVLIIVIPSLGKKDDTAGVAGSGGAATGQSAPPISPDATVPPGHPSIDGSSTAGAGQTTGTTLPSADVTKLESDYKANPKDAAAGLALARAYMDANRTADATKVYNEILVVDPKNSDAKVGLAMIAFNGGDTAGAQSKLEAIVKDDPKSQNAQYSLAVIYFSANQRDKAKATWEKVVALDPQSELGSLAAQFIQLMSSSKGTGSSGQANPHSGGAVPTTPPTT
jgi:hypothetical protein